MGFFGGELFWQFGFVVLNGRGLERKNNMSYLYQKNLELVYGTSNETSKEVGRITRQKMQSLKSISAAKAPKQDDLGACKN